jgi:hypothetical protein
VVAGSNVVLDVMTMNELTSPMPTFASDRFDEPSGAISVRDNQTFWSLAPAVYFSGIFTIITWINFHSCESSARFLDCGNGQASDNVYVMIDGSPKCQLNFGIFSGNYISGNENTVVYVLPTNGSWLHLAWSVWGTRDQVYVNGIYINLEGAGLNTPANVMRSKCFFGKSNWNGDPYADADFDEIKFFNRNMSQAEIQNDYNNSAQSFMVQL